MCLLVHICMYVCQRVRVGTRNSIKIPFFPGIIAQEVLQKEVCSLTSKKLFEEVLSSVSSCLI